MKSFRGYFGSLPLFQVRRILVTVADASFWMRPPLDSTLDYLWERVCNCHHTTKTHSYHRLQEGFAANFVWGHLNEARHTPCSLSKLQIRSTISWLSWFRTDAHPSWIVALYWDFPPSKDPIHVRLRLSNTPDPYRSDTAQGLDPSGKSNQPMDLDLHRWTASDLR